MPQFNQNANSSLGSIVAPPIQTSVADNVAFNEVISVPAAQPGTLTTRSGNTSGTLTMTNSGHGITTGQRVDLYWNGGQAYGAVVGTVAGTSVPIASVSGGTNLPVATTAITVGIPQQTSLAITGNNLSAMLLTGPAQGYFVFASSVPADLLAELIVANGAFTWYTGSGITNPLAGDTVASVWVSHSNTSGAQNMSAGMLYH